MSWALAYQHDIRTDLADIPRRLSAAAFERLPRTRPLFDYYAADPRGLGRLLLSKDGRLTRDMHAQLLDISRRGELWVAGCDNAAYAAFAAENPAVIPLDETLPEFEGGAMLLAALERWHAGLLDTPTPAGLAGLAAPLEAMVDFLAAREWRTGPLFAAMAPRDGLSAHSVRAMVLGLTAFWALTGGRPARNEVHGLALGLLLHDLGMARIPRFVVGKSSKLLVTEQEKVRQHPGHGLTMLMEMRLDNRDVAKCVAEHHERLDGSGYPLRLKGQSISLFGRIAAVADSVAAMTVDRPYAKARTMEDSLKALARDARRYDETVVKALLAVVLMARPAAAQGR